MTTEMFGTTGSTYKVVADTERAVIGKRYLGNGTTRVRVEPKDGDRFEFPENWKTPDDGNERYSVVVNNNQLAATLAKAFEIVSEEREVEEDFATIVGPGGTVYTVVHDGGAIVGLACLSDNLFRVRIQFDNVEDYDIVVEGFNDGTWATPTESNPRMSKVVKGADLPKALAHAVKVADLVW